MKKFKEGFIKYITNPDSNFTLLTLNKYINALNLCKFIKQS